MKLKVKFLKWTAGLPVAMINKKTAEKIGVRATDRISIKSYTRNTKEFSTLIDVVEGLVKENELAVSSEIKTRLNLRKGEYVDINFSVSPKSLEYIKRKLNNKKLSKKEIFEIIRDVVNNSLSEPEIALFISGMYKRGMNFEETTYLIKAILESGNKMNLRKGVIVDKHSIGGIPGNRTTPLIVSICAAAGLLMPKSSSRAITSAAGTADVIETVAKIGFNMDELKKIVKKTNACMVWGGHLGMVPADSKIIKIEKMLKIDPKAQLLASIMSKKLAAGSNYILIDIPYGKTAKVNKKKAMELKKDFEKLGRYFKKNLKCVLTKGDEPIGNGIGPALELVDVVKVLNPEEIGPKDLEEKSLFLTGELFELTKKAKKGEGILMAKQILYSGEAFKKFKEIIKAQKGHLNGVELGKFKKDVLAKRNFKVKEIDNKKINTLARTAGCPSDKGAGLYLYHHVKDIIKKGEKIMTIYAESKPRLKEAINYYKREKPILLVKPNHN